MRTIVSCVLGLVVLLCTTTHTELHASEDVDTSNLSYAGKAAYDVLSTRFAQYRSEQWELTSGRVIGKDIYTPRDFFNPSRQEIDLPEGHDDWLPEYLGEIVGRTTEFCDVMSLYMPTGKFLTELNKALRLLADRAENLPKSSPIIVRFLFAPLKNIKPTGLSNGKATLRRLTEGISHDANIHVWLGAWFNKNSINHAKIIAVDGRYVHTGGINLEENAYLLKDPILDSFVEVEGQVTDSGHYFANWQWNYIEKNARKYILAAERVSAFPPGVAEKYPPQYTSISEPEVLEEVVPIISMGNQGLLLDTKPSVDAFVALFDAATSSIKITQMDIGPNKNDYPKKQFPNLSWPMNYISAWGRALVRGVNVEIILSNYDDGANQYSAGWTCNEIASKIIKTIPKQCPEVTDNAQLRKIVGDKLRIGFLRNQFGNQWQDGTLFALHTKFVSIDDICVYIGSENLYVLDLPEWGLLFDDENTTQKLVEKLYEPMYKYSFTGEDCNFDEIFNNRYSNDCTECIS